MEATTPHTVCAEEATSRQAENSRNWQKLADNTEDKPGARNPLSARPPDRMHEWKREPRRIAPIGRFSSGDGRANSSERVMSTRRCPYAGPRALTVVRPLSCAKEKVLSKLGDTRSVPDERFPSHDSLFGWWKEGVA